LPVRTCVKTELEADSVLPLQKDSSRTERCLSGPERPTQVEEKQKRTEYLEKKVQTKTKS